MMVDSVWLPNCGRRYKVGYNGVLTDSNGKLVEVMYNVDGDAVVRIAWVLGYRQYRLALLILVATRKLVLPDYLYDKVIPLYIDGDPKNVNKDNLIYKYSEPLEVDGYPGFYHIPFYNSYAINKDNILINIKTGANKNWSLTRKGGVKNQTGGYVYSRIVNDEGFSKIIFLHRALCLVFKPYDRTVGSMVVNHLNGIPSCNELDNLEWSTYADNNQHAYNIGLRHNAAKPILLKDLKTNNIQRFESVSACARYLGNGRGDFILNRLAQGGTKVYPDLLMFKYDNGSEWPEIDLEEVEIFRSGSSSEYIARNIFTGDLTIFNGASAGSRLLGLKVESIQSHARLRKCIPINGYNIRYYEEKDSFPKHPDFLLDVYKRHPVKVPNGIMITDVDSGNQQYFESFREAKAILKVNDEFLRNAISSKKPIDGKLYDFIIIGDVYRSSPVEILE